VLIHLKNPEEAFSLIITPEMLDESVTHTNSKIQSIRVKYKKFTRRIGSTAKKSRPCLVADTDIVERRAFIGLLYLQGTFKSGHEDLESGLLTEPEETYFAVQ
jgi:hypothetical protein